MINNIINKNMQEQKQENQIEYLDNNQKLNNNDEIIINDGIVINDENVINDEIVNNINDNNSIQEELLNIDVNELSNLEINNVFNTIKDLNITLPESNKYPYIPEIYISILLVIIIIYDYQL